MVCNNILFFNKRGVTAEIKFHQYILATKITLKRIEADISGIL
jgi:hypothetical protein